MKRLVLIFCCSVSFHFWIGTLFAQESNLIQAARREGRVVWYTVAGESQQVALEFEKKYPFVKVEVVRSTVYPLLNRILNEARTGNHLFDVVRQSTFTFAQLIQKGSCNPTSLRNAKVSMPVGKINRVIGPLRTTITLSSATIPGWFRSATHRETGKTCCCRNGAAKSAWILTITCCLAALSRVGDGKKRSRISANWRSSKSSFAKGNTLIAQLIVAGEYPLGIVYAHRVELLKSQKAPMDWVSTMNPIITTGGPLGLAAKAQHPNAGKLLIDFILSKSGQTQLRNYYRIPSRADLEPLSAKLDPRRLHLLPMSPNAAEKEDDWRKQFRSIFGIQG